MSDLRIPTDFVEKNLPRAAWNLSQDKVMSLMQCLNIPVKFEILKPKDDIDVNYRFALQSMPMVGQMLNNWKLRVFCFKSDLSNYYGWMDNNSRLIPGELKEKQHHYISPNGFLASTDDGINLSIMAEFLQNSNVSVLRSARNVSDFNPVFGVVPAYGNRNNTSSSVDYAFVRDYLSVQPLSVLDMVGLPRGFFSPVEFGYDSVIPSRDYTYNEAYCFNADYILTYLDSVRNYLVSNTYGLALYFYNVPDLVVREAGGTRELVVSKVKPVIAELSLTEIDDFFAKLRYEKNGVDIFQLAYEYGLFGICRWLLSLKYGGHFLAQYEKDMLSNILYSNSYEDVVVQVDSNGNFSINQLRFANKAQRKTDREQVAGGRHSDLLRTVWGAKASRSMDIPDLVGVSSYVIDPRGVVTTADTYDPKTETGNSAGQLNGLVNDHDNAKYPVSINTDNHSIMMYMVQLVPDVMYVNGLGKGLEIRMFDDEYVPQFDQLGFQDVPRYRYNCLPTYDDEGKLVLQTASDSDFSNVVGKTIPFIDMISNVGRVHGKFSSDEYFETWVLKREFADDFSVGDTVVSRPIAGVNPYANPLKYQYPFAVTGPLDHNFVFMISFDIRAVRSKGKSYMPTLGE